MRNLRYHAAYRSIVRTLDHLIQTREPQSLHHQLLLHRGANCRTHPLQVNLTVNCRFWLFRRHRNSSISLGPFLCTLYNSCIDLPRTAETLSRLFKCRKASKVALITLWGLVVTIDLVSTF